MAQMGGRLSLLEYRIQAFERESYRRHQGDACRLAVGLMTSYPGRLMLGTLCLAAVAALMVLVSR